MSERKVLNKYYPPDYDPSKIPRGKRNKNATFNIRIMAPFNMRCNTCKDYIYKGKKFNSRKEDVTDEYFLGLRIYRFYIKCPRCVSEIAFKTDLENTDYTLEAGATRLFEAEKIAHQMAAEEQKQKEEDELNPMKVLENRTKASRHEMDQIDSLEELREMNSRKNVVNTDEMIEKYRKYEEVLQQLQMEREEQEIREIFGGEGEKVVKRLHDSDDDVGEPVSKKVATTGDKPTDILAQDNEEPTTSKKPQIWQKSVGSLSSKQSLKGLVVRKKTISPAVPTAGSRNSGVVSTSDTNRNETVGSHSCNDVQPGEPTSLGPHSESDKTVVVANGNGDDSIAVPDIAAKPGMKKDREGSPDNISGVTKRDCVASGSQPAGVLGGLGLLGAYSGSDSDVSD